MPKIYNVNINHGVFKITQDRLIKTLPQGIDRLKKEYDNTVHLKHLTTYKIDSTILRKMIDSYSEQLSPYAEEEITEWLSYTSGRMFTSNYSDLFYRSLYFIHQIAISSVV
jgi:hypothetical protein